MAGWLVGVAGWLANWCSLLGWLGVWLIRVARWGGSVASWGGWVVG